MKEKLIELLLSAEKVADEEGFFNCHKSRPKAELIAGYLIENGVIVPPCKVGDKLYIVGTECLADTDSRKCEEWTAKNPYLSCEDCPMDKRLIVFERTATKEMVSVLLLGDNENFIFGETVYLTREEAEIALKENENE